MKCPFCSNDEFKVVDSRESEDTIRRRRECLKCEKRFTTYERIETDLIVIKKDGKREPYDREKMKRGILRACEKRPISNEKIDSFIDKIEQQLRKMNSSEVKSSIIGNKVIAGLKSLDKVAYIRFASVYKDFTDIDSFQEELKKLIKETR
ncbi:MAG: transcriptional regulator NrdR [Candidatus Nanoarchaeia archaeon]|nr:transcriptional regulator NrdR [Candidatus Nanoarchaeia archaeon]